MRSNVAQLKIAQNDWRDVGRPQVAYVAHDSLDKCSTSAVMLSWQMTYEPNKIRAADFND